jgi:dTMP kinase
VASTCGILIAFEGLDQSGKQTQAEAVRSDIAARRLPARLMSFPNYETPIGTELHRALHGEREYPPDVMQLLYVANRYEAREHLQALLAAGTTIICDRYAASSVAYGEAQGLDPAWLKEIQKFLPPADVTILLDIEPGTAVRRKAAGRDRFERDLALLSRVRDSYLRQAAAGGWLVVNGEQSPSQVTAIVLSAIATRLAPR